MKILLYIFCARSLIRNNVVSLRKHPKLIYLRDAIIKDLEKKNINEDLQKSFSILEKNCGLINNDGICYFNSVIQALFANGRLLIFLIMNDFKPYQPLCTTLQHLALRMLTAPNYNALRFIERLSKHPRLVNYCTVNGGNPLILLEELLKGMQTEIEDTQKLYFREDGPDSYFGMEVFNTKCLNCQDYTLYKVSNVSISVPFSNTIEESIQFYFKNLKTISENKYYKCKKCVKFNPIEPSEIKHEFILPTNLIIVFERVRIKNNVIYSILQEIELNKNIIVNDIEYVLYSAICSYTYKKGYHANAIAFKNGKWTLFNDEQLETFSTETKNKKIFNNYAWILFFKKVNKND
ncbi:hypothetical protein COBT_003503 [Conglomerata obtusa]